MKARPIRTLTPGEVAATRQVRNVSWGTKRAVYSSYGIGLLRRLLYTVDHLVPLELNGTNGQRNLWPQPRREAKAKDRDENRLALEVAAGHISVASAQAWILRAWGPL